MSIGNLKDQGNKGNNFPYQLRTLQLLGAINDSIAALPGVDHESRTSTYEAINNGVGYSIGDIIIRYDIIDLATGLIDSTIWFNDTLQTQLTPAPLPADLTPVSAPTGVTVLNGLAGAAVNIQDGGNSITIDAASLPLPTGAATEATLLSLDTEVTSLNTPVAVVAAAFRSSASSSVAAGKRSVSIFNAGNANGTVTAALTNLLPGESISFSAGDLRDTLTAINYDATGTDFLITTVG